MDRLKEFGMEDSMELKNTKFEIKLKLRKNQQKHAQKISKEIEDCIKNMESWILEEADPEDTVSRERSKGL